MDVIKSNTYDEERALYNIKDTKIENCIFEGEKDGESPLKEGNNLEIYSSKFSLRYPIWNCYKLRVEDSVFTEGSRAPIWYTSNGIIENTKIEADKAFRECSDFKISKCNIKSNELCWKCNNLIIKDCKIESDYILFDSKNLTFNNTNFTGNYSFQYIYNLTVENCKLKTRDAFWHSNNIIITGTEIDGDYTGWYSNNLTFINCHFKGKQPFCYCTNLKLIDCTMEECTDAFEYSTVDASINGSIGSIKNPKSGKIEADSIGSIINEDSINGNFCIINIRK